MPSLSERIKRIPEWEKNKSQPVTYAGLVSMLETYEKAISTLAKRIAELEGRGLKFAGAFQRAHTESYRRGSVVTSDGSAWVATTDKPEGQPGKSAGWQLMVRGAR